MVWMINSMVDNEMWVTEDRVEEYLAAGHKLAADVPEAAEPAEEERPEEELPAEEPAEVETPKKARKTAKK